MRTIRLLALFGPTVVLLSMIGVTNLHAYPGDVFSSAAPVKGPNVETKTEVPTGTYSVATKTGAAQYNVPIVVPPGRNGMQPSLSLSYSSQNPLRGGVAAGFRLEGIPSIYVDTSRGRLAGVTYASSLAGGQRLIEVDEPGAVPGVRTFRAEHDSSYARYEHTAGGGFSPGSWVVRMPDGSVYGFGLASTSRDQRLTDPEGKLFGTEGRWMLTTATDRFGNTVRYFYSKTHDDITPVRIEYTTNDNAGITTPHAVVEFEYADDAPCAGSQIPPGARFDYSRGFRVHEGARRLTTIRTKAIRTAGLETVRELELHYDANAASCNQLHAPLRLLTAVTGTGYSANGEVTPLPTIGFSYGPLERNITAEGDFPILAGGMVGKGLRWMSEDKDSRWPTVDMMLLDLDGDGQVERLEPGTATESACQFSWTSYSTAGAVGATGVGAFPALFGLTDRVHCDLGHEFSRKHTKYECSRILEGSNYVSFRMMDLDGDRRPDLVRALDYLVGSFDPPVGDNLRTPGACLQDLDDPGSRIACATLSGTGTIFVGDWLGEGDTSKQAFHRRQAAFHSGYNPPHAEGGDTPDPTKDIPLQCRHQQELLSGRYVWRVHFGDHGDGNFAAAPEVTRFSPIPLEHHRPDGRFGAGAMASAGEWHGFVDIDGDGITDAVWQHPEDVVPTYEGDFQVFLGDGSGNFLPAADGRPYRWPVATDMSRPPINWTTQGVASATTHGEPHRTTETVVTLQDVNGDGLPDYVVGDRWSDPGTGVRAYFNTGAGFDPTPVVLADDFPILEEEVQVVLQEHETYEYMEYGFSTFTRRAVDFDGDGLVDIIELPGPAVDQINPWRPPEPTSAAPVRAYLNVGDRFVLVPVDERLDSIRWALGRLKVTNGNDWIVRTDFIDLNADGLQEAFNNSEDALSGYDRCSPQRDSSTDRYDPGIWNICGESEEALTEQLTEGESPRLLKQVTNGAGAKITFSYASTNDGTVVVREDPAYRIPSPMWVVDELRVEAGGETPPLTTSYRYINPVSQRDESGRFAFRGFETIEATGGANARGLVSQSSERYSFELDPTGRLVATAQWSCNDSDCTNPALEVLTDTTWEKHELFDGAISTYDKAEQRGWTCQPGTTAIAATDTTPGTPAADICRDTGALAREVYGWGPVYDLIPRDGFDPVADAAGDPTAPTVAELAISTSVIAPTTMPARARPTTNTEARGNLRLDLPPADGPYERALPPANALPNRREIAPELPAGEAPVTSDVCDAGPALDYDPRLLVDKVPVMWVQCGVRRTQALGAVVPGDRAAVYNHRLIHDDSSYLLLTTNSRRFAATSAGSGDGWGAVSLSGWEQTVYDSEGLGLPVRTRVWIDDTEIAVTERTFDTTTGNVITVQKPRQVDLGTSLVTTNTYDAHRIYVTETVDEEGLRYRTDVDPGTGLTLFAGGPYQPGRGWPGTFTQYDGRGRPVRVLQQFDNVAGTGFDAALVARTTYEDPSCYDMVRREPVTCAPLKIISEQRIDRGEDRWVTTEAKVDGIGRPLRSQVLGGTGPAVTDYVYDGAGQITAMRVPDPRGSGQVQFDYERDARGRVTRFVPPAGSNAAPAEITYGALTVARTQVPSEGDDSPAAPVTLTYDVYGRLLTVEETATAQGSSSDPLEAGGRAYVEGGSAGGTGGGGPVGVAAITTYEYDANDNLSRITDADGLITELDHDFLGQRRWIARASRVWRYEYDLDGNMVREAPPLPDGMDGDDPRVDDFATETAYDPIGRPTSRTLGTRDLNLDDQQRYGLGQVIYHYDNGAVPNGVGRLTSVTVGYVATDSAVHPMAQFDYAYTAQGQVASLRTQLHATPNGPSGALVAVDRTAEWKYNALGQVRETVHADDPASPTITTQTYDDRGQPYELWLEGADAMTGAPVLLARVDRNGAGMPTARLSAYAPTQNWEYDVLGRVKHVTVHAGGCPGGGCAGGVAGEQLEYDQVGNVASVKSLASGMTLEFGYDTQHQLVSVSTAEDPLLYAAGFEYTPGGRVDKAYVGTSIEGTDVIERDVTYDYLSDGSRGWADPAAVRGLLPVNGGDAVALYDYDERGSVTARTFGAEQHVYKYDGDDQLREVVDPGTGAHELHYYDHTGARVMSIELGAVAAGTYSDPTGTCTVTVNTDGTYTVDCGGTSSSGATPTDTESKVRVWLGDTELRGTLADPGAETIVHASLGGMPVAQIKDADRTAPQLVFNGVLGSLLAVLDGDGSVRARFGYGPWGEILWKDGPDAETQHRRYNGKEFDGLSRLSYYGARYYDRLSLTWTQMDPLYRFAPDIAYDEPRRMGLYVFNLGNPVRYVDPDGLGVTDQTLGFKADQTREAAAVFDFDISTPETKAALYNLGEKLDNPVSDWVFENTIGGEVLKNAWEQDSSGGAAVSVIFMAVVEPSLGSRTQKTRTPKTNAAPKLSEGPKTGKTLTIPKEKAGNLADYQKAAAEGTLVRTDPKTVRKSGFRQKVKEALGEPPREGYDADHRVELCVGGANCATTNAQWLEKGSNRKAGSKIGRQVKDDPVGTQYTDVRVEGAQ